MKNNKIYNVLLLGQPAYTMFRYKIYHTFASTTLKESLLYLVSLDILQQIVHS